VKAWTEERFSYEGRYYRFRDVCVLPKPYQKPHPPLRVAATSEETYPMVGQLGRPLFVAVRTGSISDLRRFLGGYHAAWRAAGHPGRGDVALLVPVYVAESARQAREEPEASTRHWFRSVADALRRSPARQADADRLAALSYEEILAEQVVYGTPEAVAERLGALRADLGFSSLSAWMNVGAQVPHARVLTSMRLFAERVVPRL
jgi:alkanesulfonate monooxygenase SsuD/methylene tetrahydromethanopterin reductase-like flavin-dependent oxidoreductase (luciferase family)